LWQYARGEGVGAIVFKTLSAAEADGDTIECIIREIGMKPRWTDPWIENLCAALH